MPDESEVPSYEEDLKQHLQDLQDLDQDQPPPPPPSQQESTSYIDSKSAPRTSFLDYSQTSTDDPVWSILPSYEMFTQTINKNLNIEDPSHLIDSNIYSPNGRLNLPAYNNNDNTIGTPSILSSASNDSSLISHHHSASTSNSTASNSNSTQIIVADETTNHWQETILDNIHKLKNLTFSNNTTSNNIDISVHFTKNVGVIGVKPIEIDPSFYEYKQGDYINGYVYIKSSHLETIPFDMFYLLFEGTFIIQGKNGSLEQIKIKNFLEMFDFSGSWNEAHINRLVTENYNIYTCPNLFDTIDNSYLSFGPDKLIQPNKLYKRFFTFKIPTNLLDSECNDHNLSSHIELPPTIGISYYEKILYPTTDRTTLKDFAMLDTSIRYGVLARFIGRKSLYNVTESDFQNYCNNKNNNIAKLLNSSGDEFIILKESSNFMRILQQTKSLTKNQLAMRYIENKLWYNNLLSRINDKIELGNQLLLSIESNKFDSSIDISKQLSKTELDFLKAKQEYIQGVHRDIKQTYENNNDKKVELYEIYQPVYKKSSLTNSLSTKLIGTVKLSTPKEQINIDYIPPPKFRKLSPLRFEHLESWKDVIIPIDLSLILPSSIEYSSSISSMIKKLPEVRSFQAELIVLSIKSDEHAIPIEFHHDLIFNKPGSQKNARAQFIDNDTFTNNVVTPMRVESTKLYHLLKTLGSDNFKVEKQLIDDIKSICQLQEKNINLEVIDTKIINADDKLVTSCASIPWKQQLNQNQIEFKKSFKLNLNLESASLKAVDAKKYNPATYKSYDEFNLVPNFQSCNFARTYYIKVTLVLSNNDHIRVKIPVSIQKK
ncbi:Bul1 N terminus-domain-containing protein [Scheffersomyces coipomensis]|uniref:Bul1 N terminus-domain-containing protein n=1 Tax=Scheffersomyces coipomensis TaxID=1788519 RepID=UPI00315D844C